MRIDVAAKRTVGRQIEEQLREAILDGRLAAGEPLPSTRGLAQDLSVSRGVVVRAYAQLAAEGYIVVSRGSNPQVAELWTHQAQADTALREHRQHWRFDLRPQRPDLSQFPRRQWLRSLGRALQTATDDELGHVDQRGLLQLREVISAYLARVRGAEPDPENVIITACSTHALTLTAGALLRQGHKAIAFENPGHSLQRELVSRIGLDPVGLPVDENGLLVDELKSSDVRCVVVAPAHQFPLGVELAHERRMQLLEWAERNDCLIVEHDNDSEFYYEQPPARCLQALAPELVVYIGSASKTLAPGLCLGWALVPARLMELVSEELWASTLHQSSVDHLAFADFVARGEFDRHIRRMRASYHRRRDIAIQTLAAELPGLPIRGADAGLEFIVVFPSEDEEKRAQTKALGAGIAIETVTQHALPGYREPRGLLLGFGATPEPTIPYAISHLAHAIRVE